MCKHCLLLFFYFSLVFTLLQRIVLTFESSPVPDGCHSQATESNVKLLILQTSSQNWAYCQHKSTKICKKCWHLSKLCSYLTHLANEHQIKIIYAFESDCFVIFPHRRDNLTPSCNGWVSFPPQLEIRYFHWVLSIRFNILSYFLFIIQTFYSFTWEEHLQVKTRCLHFNADKRWLSPGWTMLTFEMFPLCWKLYRTQTCRLTVDFFTQIFHLC